MKLHHFVNQEPPDTAKRLRDLGKALAELAPAPVAEARRPRKKVEEPTADDSDEGMDAAIMALTSGQKHIHKKIKHHD